MGIAVVFPGQGSQHPGMGRDFYEQSEAARQVFESASHQAGRSFTELCFDADEETLRRTENAQPALLTVGYAGWRALQERLPDLVPDYFAGHSMGEYTALAAAEVWTFEETFHWIEERARAMYKAAKQHRGAMVAILGLDAKTISQVCERVGAEGAGMVVAANYNCPGQIVISGLPEAVELAIQYAKEAGAKRAIPLAVAGAFHSPLMAKARQLMAGAYANATFRQGIAPVVSNVTARPVLDPEEWRELLPKQIESPVRWQESIEWMHEQGVDTFIEVGVGDVLTGLIKRIVPGVHTLCVVDGKTLQEAVEAVAE